MSISISQTRLHFFNVIGSIPILELTGNILNVWSRTNWFLKYTKKVPEEIIYFPREGTVVYFSYTIEKSLQNTFYTSNVCTYIYNPVLQSIMR